MKYLTVFVLCILVTICSACSLVRQTSTPTPTYMPQYTPTYTHSSTTGIKHTIQLPSGLQGVLSVENIKETVSGAYVGGDRLLLVSGIIWNQGTQTVWFDYDIYFYDSSNRLLYDCDALHHEPDVLEPGAHTDLTSCFGCDHGELVTSYTIVFTQASDPYAGIHWY